MSIDPRENREVSLSLLCIVNSFAHHELEHAGLLEVTGTYFHKLTETFNGVFSLPLDFEEAQSFVSVTSSEARLSFAFGVFAVKEFPALEEAKPLFHDDSS